ncbi:hypothetical protein ElyMa_005635600 [Elysia marginata]|uniref:Reverse transcriptase domain-containing protein n=1 Tax=Elysia marginata TaxID=1093978 RepID=A0AAV4F9E2_9GAST|nr:hypothetical protein ElyMa_005635600 [Elysia marginata]
MFSRSSAQRSGGTGSIPGRVKPKTLKLVLVADPPGVWHYGFSAKPAGRPGVRTINVGTPQGDSLSPVLFTIYLEHALKEVRPVLPKPSTPLEKVLPIEIAYADDVDFVAFQDIDIEEVGKVLE